MLFKSQQIVVALGAWAVFTLALLVLFGRLDYAFFYGIVFQGFIVVATLARPYIVRPWWKVRLDYIALAGTLAFGFIVVQKVLEIWRTSG